MEEGFEGPDFDDDVFKNMDARPSKHDGVSDNAVASHRPTTAKNDMELAIRSNARDSGCLEECEWIEPPIEDDMESLVGSNDEPTLAVAKEPMFNVQTDMRKPMLKKGMKFSNSKVFREALR